MDAVDNLGNEQRTTSGIFRTTGQDKETTAAEATGGRGTEQRYFPSSLPPFSEGSITNSVRTNEEHPPRVLHHPSAEAQFSDSEKEEDDQSSSASLLGNSTDEEDMPPASDSATIAPSSSDIFSIQRRSERNKGRERQRYTEIGLNGEPIHRNIDEWEKSRRSRGSDKKPQTKKVSRKRDPLLSLVPPPWSRAYTSELRVENLLDWRPDADLHGDPLSSSPRKVHAAFPTKTTGEYLVKWKDRCYAASTWIHALSLEHMMRKRHRMLQAFLAAYSQRRLKLSEFAEQEGLEAVHYDPEFSRVEKLLKIVQDPHKNEWALVKWVGLPYDESTWIKLNDDTSVVQLDASTVEAFRRVEATRLPFVPPPRPPRETFEKLTSTKLWGEKSLELRSYQLEGVNWILFNWYQKRSSILADEMGLGKTIQTITFLRQLSLPPINVQGPFLIVAPLSTVRQWMRELNLWWSEAYSVLYHGRSPARDVIRASDWKNAGGSNRFHVVVTTYETSIADASFLRKTNWQVVVVDEAHRLKNAESRLAVELRTFPKSHTLLLTGTPLQNNMKELWSLLHFMEPARFPSADHFLERYGDLQMTGHTRLQELHKMLRMYLLRREKEHVEKKLPPKLETIIEVPLMPLQKQYYRAIYERNSDFLCRGGSAKNGPSLINVAMELRKCCNHPYLIKGAEDALSAGIPKGDTHGIFLRLIEVAGKFVLLDKLLVKLKRDGHKVLLFSQMVRMLDILADYATYRRFPCLRIDGRVRGADRQRVIDKYTNDPDSFLMLLSTRAGGVGINLTAADTVIIYDSDWNPQNDLQAAARAHRIGQTREVKIYRLLTQKTFEVEMFRRASLKLGLDRAVLADANANSSKKRSDDKDASSLSALSAKEVDNLLKRGAYSIFSEKDDSESRQFCENDIDKIMQQSSYVVKESRDGKNKASKESSISFAKASFVPAGNDEVDLDDPDFWKKTAGISGSLVEEVRTAEDSFGVDQVHNTDWERADDDDDPTFRLSKRSIESDTFSKLEEQDIRCIEAALARWGWGRWTEIARTCGLGTLCGGSETAAALVAEATCSEIMKDVREVATSAASRNLRSLSSTQQSIMTMGSSFSEDSQKNKHGLDCVSVAASHVRNILATSKTYLEHPERCFALLRRLEYLWQMRDRVQSAAHSVDGVAAPSDATVLSCVQDPSKRQILIETIAKRLPSARIEHTTPGFWWGDAEDGAVALGVYLHGYPENDSDRKDRSAIVTSICNDPRLPFQARKASMISASRASASIESTSLPQKMQTGLFATKKRRCVRVRLVANGRTVSAPVGWTTNRNIDGTAARSVPWPSDRTWMRYVHWIFSREARAHERSLSNVRKRRQMDREKRLIEHKRLQAARNAVKVEGGWGSLVTQRLLKAILCVGAPPELGESERWQDEEPWTSPVLDRELNAPAPIGATDVSSKDATDDGTESDSIMRRSLQIARMSGAEQLYRDVKKSYAKQRCSLSMDNFRELLAIRGMSREYLESAPRDTLVRTLKEKLEIELGLVDANGAVSLIVRRPVKPHEKRWAYVCDRAGLQKFTPREASDYWWQKLYPHCLDVQKYIRRSNLKLASIWGSEESELAAKEGISDVVSTRRLAEGVAQVMPQLKPNDYNEKGLRLAKDTIDTVHVIHRIRVWIRRTLVQSRNDGVPVAQIRLGWLQAAEEAYNRSHEIDPTDLTRKQNRISRMPIWWGPVHDICMLRAISQFGFPTSRLQAKWIRRLRSVESSTLTEEAIRAHLRVAVSQQPSIFVSEVGTENWIESAAREMPPVIGIQRRLRRIMSSLRKLKKTGQDMRTSSHKASASFVYALRGDGKGEPTKVWWRLWVPQYRSKLKELKRREKMERKEIHDALNDIIAVLETREKENLRLVKIAQREAEKQAKLERKLRRSVTFCINALLKKVEVQVRRDARAAEREKQRKLRGSKRSSGTRKRRREVGELGPRETIVPLSGRPKWLPADWVCTQIPRQNSKGQKADQYFYHGTTWIRCRSRPEVFRTIERLRAEAAGELPTSAEMAVTTPPSGVAALSTKRTSDNASKKMKTKKKIEHKPQSKIPRRARALVRWFGIDTSYDVVTDFTGTLSQPGSGNAEIPAKRSLKRQPNLKNRTHLTVFVKLEGRRMCVPKSMTKKKKKKKVAQKKQKKAKQSKNIVTASSNAKNGNKNNASASLNHKRDRATPRGSAAASSSGSPKKKRVKIKKKRRDSSSSVGSNASGTTLAEQHIEKVCRDVVEHVELMKQRSLSQDALKRLLQMCIFLEGSLILSAAMRHKTGVVSAMRYIRDSNLFGQGLRGVAIRLASKWTAQV